MNANLIDTLLNVAVFAFIGLLVWLYTSAPDALGDEEARRAPDP